MTSAGEELPILLRAFAVPIDDDAAPTAKPAKDKQPKRIVRPVEPIDLYLVFDTETTSDAAMRCRIGCYRIYREGVLAEERLFYDPREAFPGDTATLLAYAEKHGMAAPITLTAFRRLLRKVYDAGGQIVGFNLPFDLSRIAIGSAAAKPPKWNRRMKGAHSLQLWDTMTFDAGHFIIEDNCGGIPKSVAEKYAFSMGRPPDEDAEHLAAAATVGMYGIGMKRAIFKLGTDALVESRHDEGFTVEFSPEWMSDRGWSDLPMFPLKDGELADGGTRITVYQLHDECKKAFAEKTWIESFRNSISRHYAIIISKGFEVRVGTEAEIAAGAEPIAGAEFRLLETDALPDGSRVQPFTYFGTLDGVGVEIYAGLYRKLLTEEEADREEQTRGVKDDAGWTVACNDRVVIWKDTTRLTGWGEATVPNYHGQFIAITGLVLLHSDDPTKLPLTTTKRGIDAASNVYAEVKDLMREATKNLTSFTYKWKKHERDLDSIYKNSRYVELPTLRTIAKEISTGQVRKFATMKRSEVKLPAPVNENRTARVSFTADKDDIAKLKKHYFDDQPAATSEVGEAAFNDALNRIKK